MAKERVLRGLGFAFLAPFVLWSCLAILFAGAHSAEISWLRWLLAAGLLLAVLAAAWRLPFARAAAVALVLFGAVLIFWATIAPSNDRDWTPDQSRTAWAEVSGPLVTLHDVRNFHYRSETDWDADWYDATFDVRELEGIDFFIVHFTERRGPAHTMVSFRFKGDRFVVFSAEIRKEIGETYGIVRGLFRQYELQYVVGDERDLVQLRTDVRRNVVHLYRGTGSREAQRRTFLDMAARLNALRARPEFYNTLVSNCTTNLVLHWEKINDRRLPRDYRILLPGYMDDLAYELGIIEKHGNLEETRRRAVIMPTSLEGADGKPFSLRIREGLGSERAVERPAAPTIGDG